MTSKVDLRSDTTTRPSAAMRKVIAEAEVGDDVFDDDPTIHLLQERAAIIMGKEAALFVPSGTMSNSIAIKVHTKPGDEILLDSDAHSMINEVALPATIAQVLTRQFHSTSGIPDVEEIASYMRKETLHSPGTGLLLLENTHNRAGGAFIPLNIHKALWKIANDSGVPVHLDGARLFNAAIAAGVDASELASCADSITFCLSKGLGCPVGSVLCGSREFIFKARRVRKMLGGGMRQAGMLAAAGIYALDNNIEKLSEDHRRAKRLAEGIADAKGIELDTTSPPTNMVYFNTKMAAKDFANHLSLRYDILSGTTFFNRIRLVTHLDIDDEQIERAIIGIRHTGSTLGV